MRDESGTIHSIIEALDDFKIHNVPDRGEIKKAKDKIGFLDDRKGNCLLPLEQFYYCSVW